MPIRSSLPASPVSRSRPDSGPERRLRTVTGAGTDRDRDRETDGRGPTIDGLRAAAYTIPTDRPESDGTLSWDRTTMIVVEVTAGASTGLGYGYADASAADIAARVLASRVVGTDAWDIPRAWDAMVRAVRNSGRPGIAATAISAVDTALWDLKARTLDISLVDLLGRARDAIDAYGSGGFTSYDDDELRDQLGGWAAAGFRMVKMKVGRDGPDDPRRVAVARDVIGPDVALFVDANGGYDRKGALAAADAFSRDGVSWFEEPVSSDDLDGLRLIRDRAPAGMRIAAGEYGWDAMTLRRLIEAGAVDVLQADATRCLGVSGFLVASALCQASGVPLSSHCAPALHVHLMCASSSGIHLEWFHDHVRIEHELFEGAPVPDHGRVSPDRNRPGLGLTLRVDRAEPYLEYRSW
jgi:L-alanine-DL-glutamate epimerase-like enolase superfamily enzyme